MFNEFIKNHKAMFTIITLLIIGLTGYTIFIFASRANKEPVNVYLIPSDTRLLVSGEQVVAGTAYLEPGTYTIEATRDGFESFTSEITIGSPNTTEIDIALIPITESSLQWQQDNIDLYYEYEGRSSERSTAEGIDFREKNPITAELPYRTYIYTIGFRADPDREAGIILEIDAITGYRNAAIRQIRDLGFDPTNFKINFRDYESPFAS